MKASKVLINHHESYKDKLVQIVVLIEILRKIFLTQFIVFYNWFFKCKILDKKIAKKKQQVIWRFREEEANFRKFVNRL